MQLSIFIIPISTKSFSQSIGNLLSFIIYYDKYMPIMSNFVNFGKNKFRCMTHPP
jgi:hypothetical protein